MVLPIEEKTCFTSIPSEDFQSISDLNLVEHAKLLRLLARLVKLKQNEARFDRLFHQLVGEGVPIESVRGKPGWIKELRTAWLDSGF